MSPLFARMPNSSVPFGDLMDSLTMLGLVEERKNLLLIFTGKADSSVSLVHEHHFIRRLSHFTLIFILPVVTT